jgi:hypothetical protein
VETLQAEAKRVQPFHRPGLKPGRASLVEYARHPARSHEAPPVWMGEKGRRRRREGQDWQPAPQPAPTARKDYKMVRNGSLRDMRVRSARDGLFTLSWCYFTVNSG